MADNPLYRLSADYWCISSLSHKGAVLEQGEEEKPRKTRKTAAKAEVLM